MEPGTAHSQGAVARTRRQPVVWVWPFAAVSVLVMAGTAAAQDDDFHDFEGEAVETNYDFDEAQMSNCLRLRPLSEGSVAHSGGIIPAPTDFTSLILRSVGEL